MSVPVAIVHDYLTQRGGAERVVLSILRAFPGAPLHTSLYEPSSTFPGFAGADIRTLALDRLAVLRRNHRLALPLLAYAFSRLRPDAEVTLCSSSGWAHGVRAPGRKIVYCYTPARWLYQTDRYLGDRRALATVTGSFLAPLRRWDTVAALGADRYLTTSTVVRDRIRDAYGIDAEILPPPTSLETEGPQHPVDGCEPGFFLCVSRLLPYKNVDAVIDAFALLPRERLVVVGTGPEESALRLRTGANVTMLGRVEDDQLRWLYAHCQAVVAAGYEDFGLTPIEAAAFGKPSAVLRNGGYLDTVVEDRSGVFFEEPAPQPIAAALRRLAGRAWDPAYLTSNAGRFSPEQFAKRLREIVATVAAP